MWHRVILLVGGAAMLLTGLDAALLRLGLPAPVQGAEIGQMHGPLMVYGFLTTLISLERAVALRAVVARSGWGYAAPAAGVLGGLLLIAGVAGAPIPGQLLAGAAWAAACTLLLTIYIVMWHAQPSAALGIQMIGAVAGIGGAALWARGLAIPQIFPWWAVLLVLTIGGERLDLARLAFQGRLERQIMGWAGLVLLTLPLTLLTPGLGYAALGFMLAVLMADLVTHDIARHTIHGHGAAQLMAACMLGGYAWAFLAALSWLAAGPVYSGYRYDFTVHAITLGFVVSMILAHAPVIVPAIVHRELPYHPVLWAVWGLLQAGLIVRVAGGFRDAIGAWHFGGALDVMALLALLGCVVGLVLSSGTRRTATRARR
ncbi:nitrite reductase (NO-forming) [Propionibacterium cyclohexanicum]|uniref:Nitrite reductase (NO-forming) n=1 Tax=Propionibacterium cyclohexanicum TaxID=64702 RepID=A0A1H9RIH1_9ACTN|nr:hypothetical protein [Propionibacterium cyclohexanicum]SER72542.1 nitrite reductase (NO-forming) [Propionibacterium cyclohexanicum]